MFNLTQQQQREFLKGTADARADKMPKSDDESYLQGYKRVFDFKMAKMSGIDGEALFNEVARGNV